MNEEERVMIAKAITKARESFEKVLADKNFELSHFELDLRVNVLDMDFKYILDTVEDKKSTGRIDYRMLENKD